MAQMRNIVGTLFIVTLILGAPCVLAGEIADRVSTIVAKTDDCNKQCEGKGTPTDIDHCKEKRSLTEHFSYATIGVGAYRQNCDKLKNDQSSFQQLICVDRSSPELSEFVRQDTGGRGESTDGGGLA
ncbi:hypothetical protein BDA96_10G066500 [Sorghum bicolor]|uniref:Secreted protein n=1 Tax=Sorghum bicolor TaxID=4558 RepID=A0A921TZU8_SORBI|nr:hypothetical protein BDA96_10G066500 [Sorghum bicolor]